VIATDESINDVVAACREHLPGYMVPSSVMALDKWPLNQNFKIDRKQLPLPEGGDKGEHIAPRTTAEQWVADAVATVLSGSSPSMEDDLLGIGLTSLMAVRLSSLLSQAHDVTLSTAMVLQHRTIAAIAACILDAKGNEMPLVRCECAEGSKTKLILSHEQKQMWVLYELDRSSPAYNLPLLHNLQGELNMEALCRAVKALAGKHEVLRMRYRNDKKGNVYQIAVPVKEWELPVREVHASSKEEAEEAVAAEYGHAMELEVSSVRLLVVHEGADHHIIVINMHHIATDGWSGQVLNMDLMDAYNTIVAGEDIEIVEQELRYADYAQWQQELLADDTRLEPHVKFWIETLGGETPVLELQTDHPRPPIMTTNGGSVSVCVKAEVADRLGKLSKECGMTVMRAVLALWGLVLWKHSGQSRVIVGTPYANREHAVLHGVVGYFVNTLAISVSVKGTDTFRKLLVNTGNSFNESLTHAMLPFTKVVEVVAPARDASRSSLYQTMLIWTDAGGWLEETEESEEGGFSQLVPFVDKESVVVEGDVEDEESGEMPKTDIELHMTDSHPSQPMKGNIVFNSDLFDLASIRRIAGHLTNLVDCVMVNDGPDVPLSDISTMTSEEMDVVVDEWNETASPFPQSSTAQILLEDHMATTPRAVAMVFEGTNVTYSELGLYTTRLAAQLQIRGAGADKVVGLCVSKSLEEVVGMVGIVRSGSAYVPLDPKQPVDRLSYIVEQCEAKAVATLGKHMDIGGCLGVEAITIDDVLQGDRENLGVRYKKDQLCNGDSLAYVLFTSGSTGKPKGVMVPHGSLVALIESLIATECFTRGDKVAYVLSFVFDPSVKTVWGTLSSGATLLIGNPDVLLDLKSLHEFFHSNGASFVDTVPSVLRVYSSSMADPFPKTLRQMHIGGEALLGELAASIISENKQVSLWNCYGPTEVTVQSSGFKCGWSGSVPNFGHSVPIGKVLRNTTAYVLDSCLVASPVGVAGELYLGGPRVTRGYMGQPDLTQASFLHIPSLPDAGRSTRQVIVFSSFQMATWTSWVVWTSRSS
jgi:amino acid adenylation domain-containing protein